MASIKPTDKNKHGCPHCNFTPAPYDDRPARAAHLLGGCFDAVLAKHLPERFQECPHLRVGIDSDEISMRPIEP
jgi:hypothetical protein